MMLCPVVSNGLLVAYMFKIKAKALDQLELEMVMIAILAYKGCKVECPIKFYCNELFCS